ncbi:hypothetical protein BD413DRAFT_606906 [Trametes elegans]|nr:hypothetical protein BD413DRAFT_606906 [Trametes elegans]
MASTGGSSSASGTLSSTAVVSTTSQPSSSSSILDGSSATDSPYFPSSTSGGAASTDSPGSSMGPPSSSLYLFTFLATLFLLLAISSAIIMRGIFLRRRFRRRLEEAIAAGVLSPMDEGPGGFGRTGGGGGRKKLKRPTLFDVTVLPPFFSPSPQDGRWDKLMPVSASVPSEKPEVNAPPSSESAEAGDPHSHHHLPLAHILLERAGYIIPRARLRRAAPPPTRQDIPASPSPAAAAGSGPAEQADPVLRAGEVQVAVIVAMPNPHQSAYVAPGAADAGAWRSSTGKEKAQASGAWVGGDEEGVPDVVFGSARVPMAGRDRAPGDSP